jgi:hypothetical protein
MPVDETDGNRRLSRTQIARYNAEIAPEVAELRHRFGMAERPERVHPFGTSESDAKYAKRGLYARGYFEQSLCFALWLHTFIAWDGNVYLCCMTTERMEPLGNVVRESIDQIMRGDRYREVRASFLAGNPHFMCHRCDLFASENRLLASEVRVAPPARGTVRLPVAG